MNSSKTKTKISQIYPTTVLPGGPIKIIGTYFQSWNQLDDYLYLENERFIIQGMNDKQILSYLPYSCRPGLSKIYTKEDNKKHLIYSIVIPKPIATGNAMDNLAIDSKENIYILYPESTAENSNSILQKINVKENTIKIFKTSISNASAILIDNDDTIYISSQIDGNIYTFSPEKGAQTFARGIGRCFGMVSNKEGHIYAADTTSGSIFKIDKKDRCALFYCAITPSSIGMHLACDKNDVLYVSSPHYLGKNYIYKIHKKTRKTSIHYSSFGFLHRFSFDSDNNLFIIQNKKNNNYLIQVKKGKTQTIISSGHPLVSVVLDKKNNIIISSENSLYNIDHKIYEASNSK